jgi:hypothetical protein
VRLLRQSVKHPGRDHGEGTRHLTITRYSRLVHRGRVRRTRRSNVAWECQAAVRLVMTAPGRRSSEKLPGTRAASPAAVDATWHRSAGQLAGVGTTAVCLWNSMIRGFRNPLKTDPCPSECGRTRYRQTDSAGILLSSLPAGCPPEGVVRSWVTFSLEDDLSVFWLRVRCYLCGGRRQQGLKMGNRFFRLPGRAV